MIDNNFVDCVIQLPANLFFSTTIATCILVLKKSKKENKTLFIDASNEFVKVTNNNKLTDENIDHIIDVFERKAEEKYFSAYVTNEAIAENDYVLSVSNYVELKDKRVDIDIDELNAEIDRVVDYEEQLRREITQIINGLGGII